MKQDKKVTAGIVLGAGVAVLAGLAITGWQVGWGPFAKLHDGKMARLPGNAVRYAPENVDKSADSPLTGKHPPQPGRVSGMVDALYGGNPD